LLWQTQRFDDFGVIIDAMFGIGLNKPLRELALRAVALINASGLPVVAADIASGVEADTGRILGSAVNADVTVTFSRAKPGHLVEPGCTCCGRLVIADIGIPEDIVAESGVNVFGLEAADARLPKRGALAHKGNFGRLLIVGGSVGYTGAPNLCARAAVRAGAGLVYLGVPYDIYDICAVKNDEAMPFPLACDGAGRLALSARDVILDRLEGCDCAVLGPGLGRSAELTELVCSAVRQSRRPLVIDADGLFAVSQDLGCLRDACCPIVLTPHEGEFARMGGRLTGDRVADARSRRQCLKPMTFLKSPGLFSFIQRRLAFDKT